MDPRVASRAEELNEYLAALNLSEVARSSEASRAVIKRIATGVEQLALSIRAGSRRSKAVVAGASLLLALLDMMLLLYSSVAGFRPPVSQAILALSILSFILASATVMAALLSLYITFVTLLVLASITFVELGLGLAESIAIGIPLLSPEGASLAAALAVSGFALTALLLKNRQVVAAYRAIRGVLGELSTRIESLARAVETAQPLAPEKGREEMPVEEAYREFEKLLRKVYGEHASALAGYIVDMLRIAGRDIREELEKHKRMLGWEEGEAR